MNRPFWVLHPRDYARVQITNMRLSFQRQIPKTTWINRESEVSAYFWAMTMDDQRTPRNDWRIATSSGRLFAAVEFTAAATREFGGRMAC